MAKRSKRGERPVLRDLRKIVRGDAGVAIHLPRALIVEEEKDLVLLDGPADRGSELVLKQLRTWLSLSFKEVAVGVEDGVAEELVEVSVELICSRARDESYVRSARSTRRCVEERCLNFDLLNRVRRRNDHAIGGEGIVGRAVGMYVHRIYAVDVDGVRVGTSSIDVYILRTASQASRIVQWRDYTRRQRQQLREVVGSQRQGGDALATEERALRHRLSLQQRFRGADLDGSRDISHLHRRVHRDMFGHVEGCGFDDGRKAAQFKSDGIVAGLERGEAVFASLIGDRRAKFSAGRIAGRDLHTWKQCTALVGNHTGDRTGGLGVSG